MRPDGSKRAAASFIAPYILKNGEHRYRSSVLGPAVGSLFRTSVFDFHVKAMFSELCIKMFCHSSSVPITVQRLLASLKTSLSLEFQGRFGKPGKTRIMAILPLSWAGVQAQCTVSVLCFVQSNPTLAHKQILVVLSGNKDLPSHNFCNVVMSVFSLRLVILSSSATIVHSIKSLEQIPAVRSFTLHLFQYRERERDCRKI